MTEKSVVVIDAESTVTSEIPWSKRWLPELYRPGAIDIVRPSKVRPTTGRRDTTPQSWLECWPALVVGAMICAPWIVLMILWPSVMLVTAELFVMWRVKVAYEELTQKQKKYLLYAGMILLSPIIIPLVLIMMLGTGKSACQCCNCC